MKKIKDIVLESTPYGDFYRDEGLIGTVLLEDNKIEGIVTDPNYNEIYFVYGKINKNSILVFLSSDKDKELPKAYKAVKEKYKYSGNKYVKNRFVEMAIEECQVSLTNPDTYREVSKDEEKLLEKEITKKKNVLGVESSYLYNSIFKEENNIKAKQ